MFSRARLRPEQMPEESVGMSIMLPIKTGGGLNDRLHWAERSRRVKRERGTACLLVRSNLNGCGLPCVVTLTRLSFGKLDTDNLQGATKGVRDGVADALGVADNHPDIEWRYAQEKCKRGAFGVRVQIEPA